MPGHSQRPFRTTELDPVLLSRPFGVQTNWHVIAGAPSCGKTTLVRLLAAHGYQTLPEGARLYLEAEMAKGRSVAEIRANIVSLQRAMAEMQASMEAELRPEDIVFLDRGLPDCLAWHRVYGLDPNGILLWCFRFRYASVFVLDRLPIHADGLRPEDEGMAAFVDAWTERDYRAMGYPVVRVPVMPAPGRMAFVLAALQK